MLVLSRKIGEQVVIAGGITITVLDVRGDKIRLGFDAPRETRIMRAELLAADTPEIVGPQPPLRKLRLAGAA